MKASVLKLEATDNAVLTLKALLFNFSVSGRKSGHYESDPASFSLPLSLSSFSLLTSITLNSSHFQFIPIPPVRLHLPSPACWTFNLTSPEHCSSFLFLIFFPFILTSPASVYSTCLLSACFHLPSCSVSLFFHSCWTRLILQFHLFLLFTLLKISTSLFPSALLSWLFPRFLLSDRGVVRVDVNLQDVDIDQCSNSGWFGGTHRCNLTSMEVSLLLLLLCILSFWCITKESN